MATYFPSYNLDNLASQAQYGFNAGLGGLFGGGGAPNMLAANSGISPAGPTTGAASQQGMFNSIFNQQAMFGGTNPETGAISGGWVSPLASLGGAIFGGIQGQQKLKLAQDQFAEGKRQFNANFEAQRKTTNTQLEDRQRARVASNPGAYESVDTYLKRNSV